MTERRVQTGGGTSTSPERALEPISGRTSRVMQRSATEILTRNGVHGL